MKHLYIKNLHKLWMLCLCLSVFSGSLTYAANKHTITKTPGVYVNAQLNAITPLSSGDTLSFVGAVFEGTNMWWNSDWYFTRNFINTKGMPIVVELQTPDVAIPDFAFQSCPNLAGIILPNVLTIGEYTFQNCSGLMTVDLPKVETIKRSAFQRCYALTTVDLPNVQTLKQEAFYDAGLTALNAPKVETLEQSTFYRCTNLTTANIPKAQTLGLNAFYGCTSLMAIDLPEAVTIGNGVFFQCSSLTTANCPKVTTIGTTAFQHCGNLISVNLPSVQTIGNTAFSSCVNLTGIDLPSVTSIGDFTFNLCASITEVDAPKLQTIGNWAFLKATGLTSIYMPTVQVIGTNAFELCSNLEFAFLNNLASLGASSFLNCPGLKYMELGAPPTFTGNAFGGSTGAVLIVVPDTVPYQPFPLTTPYKPVIEVHLRTVSTEYRVMNPNAPDTLISERDPNATLAGGGTFVWKKDGLPIAGANAHTYVATSPGLYTLEFTHGGMVVLKSIYLSDGAFAMYGSRARYEDCLYSLALTFTPANIDRTVTVYSKGSGAEYVLDVDSAQSFQDTLVYTLAKNQSILEIPYEISSEMKETTTAQFFWQLSGSLLIDSTDVFTLYPAHEITYRYYRPTVNYPGLLDVQITGGSPYMQRSLDGGLSWEWARDTITGDPLPFSKSQIANLGEDAYLLFRSPNICTPYDTLMLSVGHDTPPILRLVMMPTIADGVCSVVPGEHYIESRNDFVFTVTGIKPGYELHVSTSRTLVPDELGLEVTRNEDGTYIVRIRQIQEPVYVTMDFTVGNSLIENGRVWAVDGMLYLQATDAGEAVIHTLSGALVQRVQLSAGETYKLPLAKGYYVVTIGRKTYKVIL